MQVANKDNFTYYRVIAALYMAAAMTLFSKAQEVTPLDSVASVSLGEVEVRSVSPFRNDAEGTFRFSRLMLKRIPGMFGETDHLRFMRFLPGITSVSDYSSGMNVDGMGYSQNSYSLNGIPIQYPYHFGGIFSVMNPRVYRDAVLKRGVRPGNDVEVLGGVADVESSSLPVRHTEGELSAGMLSSSFYVALPVNRMKTSVEMSGRLSYINTIYKRFLRMDESQARYDFGDVDAVVNHVFDESDHVRATFHFNRDRVSFDDKVYSLETLLHWRNIAAGIDWKHDGEKWSTVNTAYFSGFSNRFGLYMNDVVLRIPTDMTETGLCGNVTKFAGDGKTVISGGYTFRHYRIRPQTADLTGFGTASSADAAWQRSYLAKIWGEADWVISSAWRMRMVVSIPAYFGCGGYRRVDVDPQLSLMYSQGKAGATLHVGRYHQYIHQVGFSEMGMSSNFKIGATSRIPAEQSWNGTMSLRVEPAEWVSLNADIYYKRVYDDPEYYGAVLDLANADYTCEDYIHSSDGHTYGASMMCRLRAGKSQTMASYSFGVARRRDTESGEWRYAVSDVRHSVSLSSSLSIGRHWILNGAFSYATGRRVTPIKAIYFIADRLMMEYGKRNSACLPAYHRLDLGMTYAFRSGGRVPLSHEVSLSVLNAYGHRNIEMQTMRINAETGETSLKQVGSLFRFLPSVSYSIKF